ncbi:MULTISPECIES: hypothetical protein [Nostocales]|nr:MULTISPECIES: hypothetical protein [Nostocales]
MSYSISEQDARTKDFINDPKGEIVRLLTCDKSITASALVAIVW